MSSRIRRISAADLLISSDPLSDEACGSLVGYEEEDGLVDFKVSFEPTSDKSWIDLAIDCTAFANAEGGYIVVGVRDLTWELAGIKREAAEALRDTKKVLEKINRGLVPSITHVRTRIFTANDKEFAFVHVPVSRDSTHVFESNLDWTTPTGKVIPLVSKGAIYVRRSGSNQVLTSVDFERLVQRRIDRFRERILDGVSRVVNAAPETQIVTIAKVVGVRGEAGVQIVDAPPKSDLVGRSLSFNATTLADKINLYSALVGPQDNQRVDVRLLFEAFAVRHEQKFSAEHRDWITLYSLLLHAPVFFWLKELRPAQARTLIENAFRAGNSLQKVFVLNYAGFYGESFHRKLHDSLPAHSARAFSAKETIFRTGPSKHYAEDEQRATEVARQLSQEHDQRAVYQLEKLDCALYAPFD